MCCLGTGKSQETKYLNAILSSGLLLKHYFAFQEKQNEVSSNEVLCSHSGLRTLYWEAFEKPFCRCYQFDCFSDRTNIGWIHS